MYVGGLHMCVKLFDLKELNIHEFWYFLDISYNQYPYNTNWWLRMCFLVIFIIFYDTVLQVQNSPHFIYILPWLFLSK